MKSLSAITLLLLFSCQKEITHKANSSLVSNSVIHSDTSFPIDESDSYNPCTGEYVHLTGNIRVESNEVNLGDKINLQASLHYDHVTGVGNNSGVTYKAIGEIHETSQEIWDAVNGYYVDKNDHYSAKIKLNSSLGNLTFIYTFKFVSDANGNLRVADQKFIYDECN
jgi:hypothetical protein